jgi:DNA mismatch endonuclease (patch repair protein)
MTDVFDRRKRSEIMSQVRGRGNKATELAMVDLLRRQGITGWRRHYPLFGKPDFAFPKHRLVIFVDGCFWHVCPKHATYPASNEEFWRAKLARNRARDRLVTRSLKQRGWFVLRIWQHELSAAGHARCIRRIERFLVKIAA